MHDGRVWFAGNGRGQKQSFSALRKLIHTGGLIGGIIGYYRAFVKTLLHIAQLSFVW